MSRTIAVFNQAGGVGKTTLTMNIGFHLAKLNKKVLLLDLDPQASLTVFFGLKPKNLLNTVYESLVKETPLPIHSDLHTMDLVPANINLSAAEKTLSDAIMKELRLKNALEPLQSKYDFILIDCPPQLRLFKHHESYCRHSCPNPHPNPIQSDYGNTTACRYHSARPQIW